MEAGFRFGPLGRWLMPALVPMATALFVACGGDDATLASIGSRPETTATPALEQRVPATVDDPGSDGPANLLLPDLQVSTPRELYIQYGSDGVREIRFSTTIANLGDGPLQMIGEYDQATGEVATVQRIELSDGGFEDRDVGRFVFDDGHDHWHLADFIVFELWSLTPEGLLHEVVATTGKMTFCLADSHPVADPPPNAAPIAGVTSCDQEIQGISVGWEDIYEAALPGQELDIPDTPDGRYAIRSVVDPDGLLAETNEVNNDTVSYVGIAGFGITYLE